MARADRAAVHREQVVLAHDLLTALRGYIGVDTLTFAEMPHRLRGGFFTENHAFRLRGAPAGWDEALVVRLFPTDAPADLAFREASIQTALVRQGYPAAPVLWFDPAARVLGRRAFVMRRLAGRALVGGVGPRELLRAARVAGGLPEVTAAVQVRLHALDVAELATVLGAEADGVDRNLARLASIVERGGGGFVPVLRWLTERRPHPAHHPVICHGDLWGGNILVDRSGAPTGVLDWSTGAIAEPAFDVGATALAFCLIPVPMPDRVRVALQRRGESLHRRYLEVYTERSGADLDNRAYFEALRGAVELAFVAEWRMADAGGEHDLPRPSWDAIPGELVAFVRRRTGVTITLPERADSAG